jgi:hypothetical protein
LAPGTAERRAFYGWLIGKPYDVGALPAKIADGQDAFRQHDAAKRRNAREIVALERPTAVAIRPSP